MNSGYLVLAAFSGVLLLLRWLYPPAWQAWLRLVQPIGEFMARSILRGFYLLLAGPFALIIRRQKPQTYRRHPGTSYWETRNQNHTIDAVQQQF